MVNILAQMKLNKRFKEENEMMLTSQGFNNTNMTSATLKDENSLPPLSSLNTPDKSQKMKTHTDQFYDNDGENSKGKDINMTSPKLAKAKSAFNADAIK